MCEAWGREKAKMSRMSQARGRGVVVLLANAGGRRPAWRACAAKWRGEMVRTARGETAQTARREWPRPRKHRACTCARAIARSRAQAGLAHDAAAAALAATRPRATDGAMATIMTS